jgi:hypothetical protein
MKMPDRDRAVNLEEHLMIITRKYYTGGFILLAAATLFISLAAAVGSAKADVVLGPTYPAPDGGNGFSTISGTDPAFGNKTVQYTINNPSAFSQLYWAPASISATMNGNGGVMNAVSISPDGLTATWTGSTTVTNQFGNIIPVSTEFVVKIDSGASGWLPASSLTLQNPSSSTSPLAFADLTSGPFKIEEEFLANGTPFAPYFNGINEQIPNDPNNPNLNFEKTSVSGGFYYVEAVPEPSTWAMMILGFAGVGFMAYRKKARPIAFRFA